MDLPYLRAHPEQLPTFLTHQRVRETPVAGGSICQARRITLEDGASVFVKFLNDPTAGPGADATVAVPERFFETEAAGLAWLGAAGGAPVPAVIGVLPGLLMLEWLDPGEPGPAAADRFGRELAITHRAGAVEFGASWPGYIGTLRQPNAAAVGWPEFFADSRLRPHLRMSVDSGALASADAEAVEAVLARIDELAGPAEPPARIHGDLWPGNLFWSTHERAFLVDPSAHGGHRETDLAQLALFGGAPLLDRILASYNEFWPLTAGWRARVPLHQLHLLLVHTALFGPAYRGAVVAAARAALRV